MMEKPVFKPHIRAEAVAGEGVFLLTERGHRVLKGRLFELVAPLINGQRDTEELVEALRQEASAAEVYYVLELLEKHGCLMESRERGSPAMTLFWTAQDLDPDAAQSRLQQMKVSVASRGRVPVEQFLAVLESMEIQTGADGDLGLVLADDYLSPGLEACNREALEKERPWMLLKPVGQEIFIGPIFIPGKTGCWRCLRDRYAPHRRLEQFLMTRRGRDDAFPLAADPPAAILQVALNMAAVEVARWIARGDHPELEGKMISVDSRNWRVASHTLIRRPQCPACGPAARLIGKKVFEPIKLRSQRLVFTKDCGYRTVFPEDTIKKYEYLVSPVTGVVSQLERAESVARPLHIYLAAVNYIPIYDSFRSLMANSQIMCAGKGFSEVQARASGLCEAVERRSGLFEGCESRRKATLAELGDQAVAPNDCMLYSHRQYCQRPDNNPRESNHNSVPEPFDESSPIEWSPVWSLTYQTVKYLPTQYLYYGYRYPDGKEEPVYFPACSNGNAAGNTLEEAVLQGFLELVERDCVALWWYNMVKKPAVDLASFDEPGFMELLDYYRRLNRSVWVLDITSDLGIPAFTALSRRTGQNKEQILMGFGCHLDARVALQRALGEVNQALQYPDDSEEKNWLEKITCENQPYLVPDAGLGVKLRRDYPQVGGDNLLEAIHQCKKCVEERGMEILVLDQTRSDLGMPVAKVIVPGLRHFWARFAPGRLYDVPVQMGWLEKPRKEEELNPIPMIL